MDERARLRRELQLQAPENCQPTIEAINALDDATDFCCELVELAGQCDDQTNEWIHQLLESIRGPDPSQQNRLVDLLRTSVARYDRLDQGFWAATFLGLLESPADSVVTVLEEAAGSAVNAEVRRRSSWALKRIRQPGR